MEHTIILSDSQFGKDTSELMMCRRSEEFQSGETIHILGAEISQWNGMESY